MARPPKMGVDYFPLQTDIGSDPKIKRLIRRGGKDAWTVFTWTLTLTYHDGYYSDADALKEAIAWDFRDIEEDRVEEMFELMAELNLIDSGLFKRRIITSKGIQRQYKSITTRRNEKPNLEYWLLESQEKSISVNNNSISVNNNSVYDNKSTQTEIETETEKEIEKETEMETETKPAESSDDLQSSFSDELIEMLKEAGVDVKRNTLQKISEWLEWYDPRSIEEAVEVAINKHGTGQVKSIVGYASSVLEGWANGKGSPQWLADEERALAEEKAENMKPAKISIPLFAKE